MTVGAYIYAFLDVTAKKNLPYNFKKHKRLDHQMRIEQLYTCTKTQNEHAMNVSYKTDLSRTPLDVTISGVTGKLVNPTTYYVICLFGM